MIKKFEINPVWLRAEIKEIEVARETETSVFKSDGRRLAKKSQYSEFHDTWEDAHAALMEAAEIKVKAHRRALEVANSTLGNIKGMKKLEKKKPAELFPGTMHAVDNLGIRK